jgi:hypothetical protein
MKSLWDFSAPLPADGNGCAPLAFDFSLSNFNAKAQRRRDAKQFLFFSAPLRLGVFALNSVSRHYKPILSAPNFI